MLNIESNFLIFTVGFYGLAMVAGFLSIAFKKSLIDRAATWLLAGGLVLHTVSLGARIAASGRLPFANLYESMTSFAWGIALIILVVNYIYNVKAAAAAVTPIAFLAALYATTLNKAIEPLMPALQSNWLLAHVGVAIVAYGIFAFSFGTAVLYLVKAKYDAKWLPAREKLDELTYKLIAFAFPFMILVIITGAVWAEQAWGTYWSWDPKETWSLITTLIYLGYLHARLVMGWKGKVAAWFAVVGFLAVIFTYLGVSFLLSGLHSYAQ
ncbi:c-type cytochrome biogenesis protein CcsB [candidate division WOR-1 bacterium RIFCSPHIGHO2_01_FULL_53_15]|uniref:Heme exporter protein C n=1 Tax=candidate division WOR-1 bacterium RIFCSPHIGHO2_01_FULL_53_15 TaxID=1802564 RepID=A0A1F4Q3K4_UNCSA|nr:MAG: c-type cytochrome biogenesis protein CcsB [candidate division WOR-1 bacterium RIFCSPHIGHO2_01_FULL_53_15]OGC12669.1 MAG: c-type cytochrome biogenesis protein CcsB [candidate division WOR-1 bacterium RIFCSPHIGHO2_02_FULL_53_26]